MPKQYWLFDKETLVINQTAKDARCVAGQYQIPRTALLTKPLVLKDGFQVCAKLDESGCAVGSEYVEDNRGETVYLKTNPNQSKQIETLGKVDGDYTLDKPITQFDEWVNNAWVTNEQLQYEAKLLQVESTRRALYMNVDALSNEAAMIRVVENDEIKATDYEEQAKALYLKIRDENPWPTPPAE